MSTLLERYEDQVQAARARFGESEWAVKYIANAPPPEALERFLINFCALGFQMTQPVESWIARAGERCTALGLHELGAALAAHARHEAGHEQMMAADARALVERRVRAGRSRVDVEPLLSGRRTPGVARYASLHEATIAGAAPYGQLAIEYEIERLSVGYGATLIRRCVEILGADVRDSLSFLEDHVALDAGHTQFNARQLQRLLEQHPAFLGPLVEAGGAALDAYRDFLDDCQQLSN